MHAKHGEAGLVGQRLAVGATATISEVVRNARSANSAGTGSISAQLSRAESRGFNVQLSRLADGLAQPRTRHDQWSPPQDLDVPHAIDIADFPLPIGQRLLANQRVDQESAALV